MGIDGEERDGKPLGVLDARSRPNKLTTERKESIQKQCTFERLATAGIDFLIHDGVDCVRWHLLKNCHSKLKLNVLEPQKWMPVIWLFLHYRFGPQFL